MPEPLDLPTLQAVRLKGRATPTDAAGATGRSEAETASALQALADAGLLVEKNNRFRVTPEGKEKLGEMIAADRAEIDADALEGI